MSEQPGPSPRFDFKPVARPALGAAFLAPDLPPYFVPRAELGAIKRLLVGRPAVALAPVTLHGPAGSGKTSLAAALAHDADILQAFPDGVLWASLPEGGSVQHAQAVWAGALGEDLAALPDTASRSAALRTLLRDRRALLILDGVTGIEQVKALNVGGPSCARIITSGAGDGVLLAFKTRRYAVGKLSEDEALALLAEWAGMLPSIYLPTVREIIQRLSNAALPLALVGAQARQGITWMRLLELLQDEQGPLAALDGDAEEVRARALRLVVNLALSRFGGGQLERAALLTAFQPGMGSPFSAGAAAACWGLPLDEARDALSSLVEAAMLRELPGGLYTLHEALREPLRERAEPGTVEAAAGRVHRYYAELVETAPPTDPQIGAQLGQIAAAFHALREDEAAATLFAGALMRIFEAQGLWADLAALLRDIVGDAREAGDIFREHAYLSDLGYALTVLGELDEARHAFARSLTICRNLGDPAGEASALNNLGAVEERQGDLGAALAHYEEALSLREGLGSPEDVAEVLLNIAGVLYTQERWDAALAAMQRALDVQGAQADRRGQASTWLLIGAAQERLGRLDDAEQSYLRARAIYANLDDAAGEGQALNNLGIVYFSRGEAGRALEHFGRSLAVKEQLGDRYGQATTLNNIALVYEKMGDIPQALDHFEQSYQLLNALADPRAAVVRQNIDELRAQVRGGA